MIFENNNINSIDVNRLDKGIYLIEIDGVKTKFVKK
ncbi:MAG: T9SS type A sorting domain-containing protein [Flavobacteriales bacterium]|nr:T9SS type A sorting domain-containing protein [Flavobacteriales bacterium]MBT5090136.1 T9SS type A sorting domain-containing protein [Flavobacteriales bacterium]MBT5751031.1 T9SS type A sorting domain-containing protein [Flavobacteriales bacterium]